MSNHLFDFIRARMPAPDKPFIETGEGRRFSHGDAVALSGRMAAALVALGVEAGDRVAVQVDKSAEAIMLYLACVRAGAVFLPLNTAYTASEVEYFLGDAEPRLFICAPAKRAGLETMARSKGARVETMATDGGGSLMEQLPQAGGFKDVERGAGDLAAILYTSGTTGRSKGAMLSHANLASNAEVLASYWRFGPQDVLLHALPIFHTHGLFVATNVVLATGGSMLFLGKFDADDVMRLMPRATTMMGVPTFYVRLLQHPGLTRAATRHMRLFVSGSAPLLAETHEAWREKAGHAILERYGMTETNMNTSNPYDGERRP
ncbi:MAG: AMP-binding protein, partial [Alphaproteobacteria bacterium]|nr:AMP-binding protein [Alphaproteobacteria bacterium]